IALFKQSLDTRSSRNHLRKKQARVYFGHDWLRHSPAELWKNELMRFPLLLTSDDFQDATQVMGSGETPNLRAIRLHNGTTYTWNRLCYGPQGDKPHLRIECRYLPAGPTVADEIANFAFWVGLMEGQPDEYHDFWKKTDFRLAKDNFIRAARTGLASVIDWFEGAEPAQRLILDKLVPIARSGLEKAGVDSKDIDYYLGLIDQRIRKQQTGSNWQIQTFRKLTGKSNKSLALKVMSQQMIEYQLNNTPVSEWDNLSKQKPKPIRLQSSSLVEDIMSTDIFMVHEEASLQFVDQMMRWKNIHHVPVEDKGGNLIGMITDGLISRMEPGSLKQEILAKDIMITEVITADAKDSLEKAGMVLQEHQLSCLPIVYHGKIVGILTEKDIESIKVPLSSYT
ncbi:MAG: CBS domain-containing protein, partial [Saprospiraceae bacterium]|nr:CBS domain-containing protein [Saprospiraceae bacterium]